MDQIMIAGIALDRVEDANLDDYHLARLGEIGERVSISTYRTSPTAGSVAVALHVACPGLGSANATGYGDDRESAYADACARLDRLSPVAMDHSARVIGAYREQTRAA